MSMKIAGILDTGVCTENSGDLVIMDAAKEEAENALIDYQLIYFPTHEKLSSYGRKLQKNLELNIACGSNLLHSHMGIVKQWNIGLLDAFTMKPTVLLGVGWRSHKKRTTDLYTKWLLNKILSHSHLHSVRDSYAESKIKEMGFNNVINTGCPTTWSLTKEHCQKVPTKKGENAIVVLTDYSQDIERDSHILNVTIANYEKVYFWCQGSSDRAYVDALGYSNKVEFIPSSLKGYRNILEDKSISLDYVGTRLHGGIFALRNFRRSVIIAVDHRANEMGKDLNLPVIDRYKSNSEIEDMILLDLNLDITLPQENINTWRNQFNASK
jgi:polysaccharide pyruvyl transferase WcaK-like protein